MVMIDEREWDEMRKDRESAEVVHLRRNPRDPEMNGLDVRVVAKNARLTIPLTHSRQLRRHADQLRALAGKLETLSTYTDVRERTILMEAWFEIRAADRRIKNIGSGKTPEGKDY